MEPGVKKKNVKHQQVSDATVELLLMTECHFGGVGGDGGERGGGGGVSSTW